jgi:hypothetical protein
MISDLRKWKDYGVKLSSNGIYNFVKNMCQAFQFLMPLALCVTVLVRWTSACTVRIFQLLFFAPVTLTIFLLSLRSSTNLITYKHNFKVDDRGGCAVYLWVCDRSLAGIAGLNPAEGMNVRFLQLLCVVLVYVSATGRSLVQRSPTECVCNIECDQMQQQPSTPTVSR